VVSEFAISFTEESSGPTGQLRLHGRKESWRDPKYPRRILDGETPESRKKGPELIGSQLGKELI